MAIAYTAERYAARTLVNDNKSVISPTSTVASGSTAIIFCGSNHIVTSVTDTKSNTWTVDHTYGAGGSGGAEFRSLSVISAPITASILTSDSITVNYSTAGNFNREHYIIEVAGLASSPYDKSADATNAATTTISCGPTATLAQADEIAFCFMEDNAGRTLTVGGSWTQSTTKDVSTAHLEYQIVAATTALTGTGTLSGSADTYSTVVTYKGVALVTYTKAGYGVLGYIP